MGLAASQVRLLSLTSRQHAVEYEAQRIEAQKLQLANESDQVYNTYLAALDATKIQYKVVANDGSAQFNDATFTKLAEAGFLFRVDNNGGENTYTDSYAGIKQALSEQGVADITAGDSYSLVTTLVTEGYVVLLQQKSEPDTGYEYKEGKIYYNPGDGSDAVEYDPDQIDDQTGQAYLYHVFEDTSVSTSTKVQEVSDEIGLKKAEAQYEADMNRINAKDTRYDTKLSQLETERDAIKTEIETLETVENDNIERTFKLFA